MRPLKAVPDWPVDGGRAPTGQVPTRRIAVGRPIQPVLGKIRHRFE
jgi:hypothetical protein